MKRKQFTRCVALVAALSTGGSVWAAENVALGSGLWSNAVNWSEGHVPNTTDDRAKVWGQATVTVDYVAPDVSNIRLGSSTSHRGKVVIDSAASLRNQGILEISGGHPDSGKSRLNVAGTFQNDGIMNIGHVNGATTPGGALQVSSNGVVTANNTVNIGYGANGIAEILGGTFTQTGGAAGNKDTYIGSGYQQHGELFMDGGSYTTGDDLILAGNGNSRIAKVDLNGGGLLQITDSVFGSLNNSSYSGSTSEIIVSDATMDVGVSLYLGRYQDATLTLDHADADVNAWGMYLSTGTAGTTEVNLLDGVLTVEGSSAGDTLLTIGAGGSIDFEKGVLEWIDNTTEDELQAWWEDGTFSATKNGGNPESFTNILDSISYTTNFGDGFTAWVGLDGIVAKTFVTTDLVVVIGDISINLSGIDAVVGWNGTNGANYTLQSKSDLTDLSWSDEQIGIPGVDGSMSATTTVTSAESFYRVTSP